MFVCPIAAKIDWLATIDDDQIFFELIQLKWRTIVVEFNPKKVIYTDIWFIFSAFV